MRHRAEDTVNKTRTREVFFFFLRLTYPVQSVDGNRFKGSPHHGIFLQHLIEVVHRERVQATVGVRSHAGRPSATGQQTDLWGGEIETQIIRWLQIAGGHRVTERNRAETL